MDYPSLVSLLKRGVSLASFEVGTVSSRSIAHDHRNSRFRFTMEVESSSLDFFVLGVVETNVDNFQDNRRRKKQLIIEDVAIPF